MSIQKLSNAIVFDLDGTLVDSLPDLGGALNRLLSEMGRRPVALGELRNWVGDGGAMLVERALVATGGLGDVPLAELVKRFLGFYKGHTAIETKPFPGVETVLEALKASGFALGVCTNKPTDLSIELLDSLGLTPFFSAVLGGDSVPSRKPHPGHILATLEAMGQAGAKALMVGDSPNDVAAARAAALPVVVVSFGYTRVKPEDLGADLVIGDFADLPGAVTRFFN